MEFPVNLVLVLAAAAVVASQSDPEAGAAVVAGQSDPAAAPAAVQKSFMESCWGEEDVKAHDAQFKAAVIKCKLQEPPAINFPPLNLNFTHLLDFEDLEDIELNPEAADLQGGLVKLLTRMEAGLVKARNEVGNMTCFYREFGISNENNELDYNLQIKQIEKYDIYENVWFRNRYYADLATCHKVAASLPVEAQTDFNIPGLLNLSKAKALLRCMKETNKKTCQYRDLKDKIEAEFGQLEDILAETDLTEDQLFELVLQGGDIDAVKF